MYSFLFDTRRLQFEGAWEPYVNTIGDLLSLVVVLCDWPRSFVEGPIWVPNLGLSIRHMEMSVNKVVRRYASPFGLDIYLLLLSTVALAVSGW